MHDATSISDDLLLLSLLDGGIYLLRSGEYNSFTFLAGEIEYGAPLQQFVELQTDQLVFLGREDLNSFLVPDSQVSEILQEFGISGLRPARMPSPSGCKVLVPFFGNLVDPTWLSICVGGRCDSRCTFCFTEWIRYAPQLTSEQIRYALGEARSIPTLDSVVFSGGEPTLRPDLLGLIAYAVHLGYSEIGLQSNGHKLAASDYAEELATAGVTNGLISLHGSQAATHDRITAHLGSFEKVCRALAVASRRITSIEVNYVVCKQNVREVVEVVDLINRLAPGAAIRYSFPIIEGAAYENIAVVVPDMTSYARWVSAARIRAEHLGIEVSSANVPACISEATGTPPAYLLSQRKSMLGVSPFFASEIDRGERLAKFSICRDCTWFGDCGGVQIPYLREFPLAYQELIPRRVK